MASRYEVHIKTGGTGGSGPTPPSPDAPIRDAHVIVVAQANYLAPLSSVASPPMPADNLTLDPGVGDRAGYTCDYLDPGDGSQLLLALAAAAAATVPVDIRLRPCSLVLTGIGDSPGLLDIPLNCRLIGAGAKLSTITGTAGIKGQTVLNLAAGAHVEDLTVISPAPTSAPAASSSGVVHCAESCQVLRSIVHVKRSASFNRIAINGILFDSATSPAGKEVVSDCELYVDTMRAQPAPVTNSAVVFGSTAQSILTDSDPRVMNTIVGESTKNAGACSTAVQFLNFEGGLCENVEHIGASFMLSFIWSWSLTPAGAVTRELRGPKWVGCRANALAVEPQDTGSQSGFLMTVSGTPNLVGGVRGAIFDDCSVQFYVPVTPDAAAELTAFALRNTADIGDIYDTTFDGCRAQHAHRGFVIEASVDARIEGVRMTGCQARDTIAGGAAPPRGVRIIGNGDIFTAATVIQVSVVNSDFRGVPATGVAVEVVDLRVEDTIIVGNNLTPDGGTAIVDAGTGTQAGLNIMGTSPSFAAPDAILGANLTGWWDDSSTVMTGATWTNKTGGTDFTQATLSFRPNAGTPINGLATLHTDGIATFMDAGAISGLYSAGAFCLWIVARPLGVLIAGPPVVIATDVFVTDTGGYTAAGCATDARGVVFDTGTKITSSPGVMVSGTVYQIRLRLASGVLYYRLMNSGGLVGEGSIACGNIGVLTGLLRFGLSYAASLYQEADFGGIVTTNIAPSTLQLDAMDDWTFSKWGV